MVNEVNKLILNSEMGGTWYQMVDLHKKLFRSVLNINLKWVIKIGRLFVTFMFLPLITYMGFIESKVKTDRRAEIKYLFDSANSKTSDLSSEQKQNTILIFSSL